MSSSPSPARETRFVYLDVLRALAILMVVAVHVVSNLMYKYNTLPASWWWIANVVDSLSRACVPLFVMVSGALLLDPSRHESLSEFFSKRLRKVLLPFLAWTVIYVLWRLFYHDEPLGVREILVGFAEGTLYGHLWFVYMLLGLYLAAPLLRALVRGADERTLRYLIGLWFIVVSIVPILNLVLDVTIGLNFVVVTGYTGYFVLGYFLHRFNAVNPTRWFWFAAAALGALVTMFGTYWITLRNGGQYDGMFYDYLSPNVIVMAVFLFALAKRLSAERFGTSKSLPARGVAALSATSYSTYLMHVIVLEAFKQNRLSATSIHPLVGIPLTIGATLVVCVGVTLLMRRIPLLKEVFQ